MKQIGKRVTVIRYFGSSTVVPARIGSISCLVSCCWFLLELEVEEVLVAYSYSRSD